MNNKLMETLENLEEKMESIKWLISASFSFRKAESSGTIGIIRKSAGILGKDFSAGTSYENRIRKEWNRNSLKRTA